MTPAAQQRSGRGRAPRSGTRTLARGVLVAALVFTTIYTGYVTVSVVATKLWMSTTSRSLAMAALLLGTLLSVELLVLGLNVSFLADRLIPRQRLRVAYVVLAATAAAAFGLAVAGSPRFAAFLASLLLPGAAAYGILALFSPAYVAKQEERARERATARAARSGRTGTPRPPSKPDRERAQTSTRAKQRRGGRKRR